MVLSSSGNATWHHDPAAAASARFSEMQGHPKAASADSGGEPQEEDGSEWLKAGLEGVPYFIDGGQLPPQNSSSHPY